MDHSRQSAQSPTARLTTPDVGDRRSQLGEGRRADPRPESEPQGTQRGVAPLGCGSQSGLAEGPHSFSFLDFNKHNCNNFCRRWSIVGEVRENGNRYDHYAALGCKGWDCPVCGPKKARRLRQAIIEAATRNDLRRFLTLTLDPRYTSSEESIKYIRECWRKFRVYLKRRTGKSIDFIAVVELHKSGYAHLHILIDRYIPQQWIQSSWQAVGGGRFVNIKHVDVHRIAAYLSKYLTKEVILGPFRPGTRRYSTSRGVKLFKKPPKGLWKVLKLPIEFINSQVQGIISQESVDGLGLLQWFRIELATQN